MEENQLRRYEQVVFGFIVASALLAVMGLVALATARDDLHKPGVYMAAFGILGSALAIALSYPLKAFKTIGREAQGALQEARRYSYVKIASIFLNLIWIATLVGLLSGLLSRLGVLHLNTSELVSTRVAAIMGIVLVVNLAVAHLYALRVSLTGIENFPTTAFHYIGLAVTAMWPVAAMVLLDRSATLAGLRFASGDATLFLLTGAAFAAVALSVSRPIPNLFSIFREGHGPLSQGDYLSRTKSVLFPAFIAFALLFLLVFIILLVGVGPRGIQSPVQGLVFVFIIVALVASVIASIRLARTEDTADLYTLKTNPETRVGNIVLYTSLGVALIFCAVAAWLLRGHTILFLSSTRWVDLFSIGLMVGFGPYGYLLAVRSRRIRRLEERFPDFLRDVAASHRGGLTLAASVQIAARGEYGELTPEIHQMADQLSWNIPFNEALTRLLERVHTPLIQRTVTLIVEASRSGGNTTDVLLAAARDAREIKNLENERRTTMALYSIIIYITFFVFLTVAAVLYGKFVPEILKASHAAQTAGTTGVSGLSFDTPTKPQFRAFYFMAGLVQGVGNGMVAGLFQHGRATAGLRHAFMMVLITYVTFTFVFH